MSLAVVARIHEILPHPDADRLEVILIETASVTSWSLATARHILVVGKHYRAGDLGVWLRPGGSIDGQLAHHLWMVGKTKASDASYRFTVEDKEIRGVRSPGLWIGEFYQTDTSAESHDHARELLEMGGSEVVRDGQSWIRTPYWRDDWEVGDEVDWELGVLDLSHAS